jgi:hypothetical protein
MNTDFSLLQKLENLLQKLSKMQPLLQKLLSTFVGKCNSQLKLIRMKTYVDKLLHFLKLRETFCNNKVSATTRFLQQNFHSILRKSLYIWTPKTG